MAGTLFGLGIGPGDPELITLKALRILKRSQVVAYPAPEQGESLARSIVAPHLDGSHEEVMIRMPMTAARFPAQEVYDQAARELGSHLQQGRDVAVLCEGDPFFYGSFMYLFGRMASQHHIEVVPGVSSLMACATTLGAPLAARNDVLTVVPATLPAEQIRARIADVDAVAIIKLGRHFDKVRRLLEEMQVGEQARYVEHATMGHQRILSMHEVDASSVPYFSMILVHCRGNAWHV